MRLCKDRLGKTTGWTRTATAAAVLLLIPFAAEPSQAVPPDGDIPGPAAIETNERPFLQEHPFAQVLKRRVSLQLQDATVGDFITTLARDEQINVIADQDLSEQHIHINVKDAPLGEVLEFIARNYGVRFSPRENTIWVVRADKELPMETVIFPLQYGVAHHADGWGSVPAAGVDTISALGSKAAVTPTTRSPVEQMIEALIPEHEHSRTHVDPNTNTLIVRHTAENLRKIADIVRAVDVRPVQISIEARFVEVRNADLREVGLEWLMDSPFIASQKGVFQDGEWQRVARTQIDEGAHVGFTPFTSDTSGSFPLGPLAPFSEVRSGDPPTADQGLNLTYRGVMTDPMFRAVLHALEVSGRGLFLSAPRVTTVNNHPAKMRDGEDMLYYERFRAQSFTFRRGTATETVTNLVPRGAPVLAELGITLVVVPSVGADKRRISMLISSTVSALERFENYQGDAMTPSDVQPRSRAVPQAVVRLPVISRREVQTKAIVDSGETIVLGGLTRSVEQQTEHRVPILGSLPLIGRLFRSTTTSEDHRNLLIFITADVILPNDE